MMAELMASMKLMPGGLLSRVEVGASDQAAWGDLWKRTAEVN
jgi:hypothetical protein